MILFVNECIKRQLKKGICVAIVLWSNAGFASESKPFFNDHARGWFWYEDPEVELLEPQKDPTPDPKALNLKSDDKEASPKPKTAIERLNEVQVYVKELKAKAILEPTPHNVKAYQEMQLRVVNQSQAFSDAWLRNVYLNPKLDESVRNPTAQGARFVVYENERIQKQQIIKDLKNTYGLFYFYSGSCSYCKAFAPVIKQFADAYGWEVIAISLDGAPSDTFKNWQPDNGISKKWGVQTVPAVFAINPETDQVIPVANGFTSIDEMEKRIVTLVKGEKS
jgi:conjugal transfer pilus assembly protein TraF